MHRRTSNAVVMAGVAALVLGQCTIGAGAAENPHQGDLRNIRLGVSADQVPAKGFAGYRCMTADGAVASEAAGWTDYEACPLRADGLRELAFGYDDPKAQSASVNDKWVGTRISGHPVTLSLLFDERGIAMALHINTDSAARGQMRKQAFLFRLRVWQRYGRDGWACDEAVPDAGLSPVGRTLINETCRKQFGERRLTLTTRLYRTPEQAPEQYTNETRVKIEWASGA